MSGSLHNLRSGQLSMPTSFSRARLGAAVVTAFVCGLLFASGFDLTRFGFAQDGAKGAKVASSQVQSLAETGSAFEAIADHVTPSVVSIQTTRVATSRQRSNRPDIEEFFRNFQPTPQDRAPQEASGTGFIVSKGPRTRVRLGRARQIASWARRNTTTPPGPGCDPRARAL